MMSGSGVLRIGLGASLLALAILFVLDPTQAVSALGVTAGTAGYVHAALSAFLGITILFSLFPRIAPLLGAAYFFILAFFHGWGPIGVRDFGLGAASLALVVIHEEHIPTRMRNVMARMFSKR